MSSILSSPPKYTRLRRVSFYNPSLSLYAICSVLHKMLFLSLASSTSCFHRLPVTNCEMPRQNESTENVAEATTNCKNSEDTSPSWGVTNLPIISHTAAPPLISVASKTLKNVENLNSQH